MDLLAERIADEQRAARARADQLRGLVGDAARLLGRRGARRAWLFGSLAGDGAPHARTDVDLAAEGLPELGLIRTILELEDLLGAPVDLVRLEEASDGLRSRILAEGRELDVTG